MHGVTMLKVLCTLASVVMERTTDAMVQEGLHWISGVFDAPKAMTRSDPPKTTMFALHKVTFFFWH